MLAVATVPLSRLKVEALEVKSPPLIARSPAVVMLPLAPATLKLALVRLSVSSAEPMPIVSAVVLFVPMLIALPAVPVPRLMVLALLPVPRLIPFAPVESRVMLVPPVIVSGTPDDVTSGVVTLVVPVTLAPCTVEVVVMLLAVEITPKPVVMEPADIAPPLLTTRPPEPTLRLLPASAPVAVTVAPCTAEVVVMLLAVEITPKPVVIEPFVSAPALLTLKLGALIRLVKVPAMLIALVAVPAVLVRLSRLVVVPPAPFLVMARPLV